MRVAQRPIAEQRARELGTAMARVQFAFILATDANPAILAPTGGALAATRRAADSFHAALDAALVAQPVHDALGDLGTLRRAIDVAGSTIQATGRDR